MLDMAARGSLFVQHLKQEGIVVVDDNDFLSSTFARYRPKSDLTDIKDSITLLRRVSRSCRSDWGSLCSSDIAYVAIRNVAIHQLAAQGIYKFDYRGVINELNRACEIGPERLEALHRLRHMKYAYRNRINLTNSQTLLERALEGAEELLRVDIFGVEQEEPAASGYVGLRTLELALVTKVDPRYLDSLPVSDPLAGPWANVRDPRGYPKPWKIDDGWILMVGNLVKLRFG
jgi:hypothetical protein